MISTDDDFSGAAPSFEEFKRNRAKYLGRDDEDFGLIDKGPNNLKSQHQRTMFEIEGYRCRTLEEVERIASDHGISIRDLDYRPQLVPQSGLKCDILVRFLPKTVREKREKW